MKLIPTRESRAVCVWDTDEYVSHIDSFFKISCTHFFVSYGLKSTNTIILSRYSLSGKYERECQQKHQLHELHEICNLKKKSSFPFLRLGENLPSDAMRYMVCLIDNVDKC